MKQPLIFFIAVVIVVSGFVLLFTNFSSAPEQLTKVIIAEPIDDCFDSTMATWFEEFNASQENGSDISEADNKASEVALLSFDECLD